MKILQCVNCCLWLAHKSRRRRLSVPPPFLLLFLGLVSMLSASGQDIKLRNPSMEGIPKQRGLPPEWINTSYSPDTQPGWYGVALAPSDGLTYIGGVHGTTWDEGVGQLLSSPLLRGKKYMLSFDLAYPEFYTGPVCAGTFVIYGENEPGDKAQVLWRSGRFNHKGWQQYTAILSPTATYKYISFYGYSLDDKCPGKIYTGYLVDNLSSYIYEVPQVEVLSRNSCKGLAKGSAALRITGGIPPFRCRWSNGQESGEEVRDLNVGGYEVIVTGANGAAAKEKFTIGETEVLSTVELVNPSCYGYDNGAVKFVMKSGFAPYAFELNNGAVQNQPDFTGLRAGRYQVSITDTRGCKIAVPPLVLTQPDPLRIAATKISHVSCNDTHDGKITLETAGGTLPYTYQMEAGAWQSANEWVSLDEGRYYYVVKDKNQCTVRETAEVIRNMRECAVYVPTAFSPNGDGLNDVFRARVNDDISDYRLFIYNRWGGTVFQTNNPSAGWDGMLQPVGSYIWVITYTDSKRQPRKQMGHLTLVR